MAKQPKTLWQEFTKGIIKENPVLRLVLGTCATLAVSTAASNAIGMGLATTFVLVCSNAVISLLRKVILLLPLSLVIPRVFGALGLSQLLGLYLAEPISDIVSASTCTILFFVIEWKKLKDSPRTAQ